MTNANERPYLWLLYVIVLVMPFVLCAACCVKSKVSTFIRYKRINDKFKLFLCNHILYISYFMLKLVKKPVWLCGIGPLVHRKRHETADSN